MELVTENETIPNAGEAEVEAVLAQMGPDRSEWWATLASSSDHFVQARFTGSAFEIERRLPPADVLEVAFRPERRKGAKGAWRLLSLFSADADPSVQHEADDVRAVFRAFLNGTSFPEHLEWR
ncbi:MAG TPA: hypothetical protein VGR19_03620 [Allosphingosinicella sp.]|nr:hypothetical protein [Allosphingosinicella sp.]